MLDPKKIAPLLGHLPKHKQAAVRARTQWLAQARPKQVPPSDVDWFVFVALAGRGFGKSKLASQEAWWHAAWNDGARVAIVAPTAGDLRRTCFEGQSGILNQVPQECLQGGDQAVAYNRSLFELRFENGSVIQGYSAAEPDRLRGPNHGFAICLVGDTAVTMGDGSTKPIRAVRAGDKVMTRAGPRRVLASAMTHPAAEVLGLITSCDTVVLGTTKHLFYSPSRGFVPLGELRTGDALCRLTESNGTAATGGSAKTDTITTTTGSCSTARSMRRTTGQSRPAGSSTMRMRTRGTTTPATLPPCPSVNIHHTTTRDVRIQTQGQPSRPFGSSGPHATRTQQLAPVAASLSRPEPLRDASGFSAARSAPNGSAALVSEGNCAVAMSAALNMKQPAECKSSVPSCVTRTTTNESGPRPWNAPSIAHIAERRSQANALTLGSAPEPAPSLCTTTVRAVESSATREPVYDLTVEGEPEFFANGILVHNCDEVASWSEAEHCWDMLTMTLRIGERPQVIVTTTPRPVPIIRNLLRRQGRDVYVVRGSTFENEDNLAPSYIQQLRARYQGTRLGRQELEAEVLEDVPGALWTRAMLDQCQMADLPPRLPPKHSPEYGRALAEGLQLSRVVVGVDPSGAKEATDKADEIGIVVAGIDYHERGYVLEDASAVYSPDGWGKKTIEMFDKWGADLIVAEGNYGGGLVQANIRSSRATAPVVLVTATRGKAVRAEPIASLYEQNRVLHCDHFPRLEEQMSAMTRTGYHGDGSPDRIDSLVWCLTELMLNTQPPYNIYDLTGIRPPGT